MDVDQKFREYIKTLTLPQLYQELEAQATNRDISEELEDTEGQQEYQARILAIKQEIMKQGDYI